MRNKLFCIMVIFLFFGCSTITQPNKTSLTNNIDHVFYNLQLTLDDDLAKHDYQGKVDIVFNLDNPNQDLLINFANGQIISVLVNTTPAQESKYNGLFLTIPKKYLLPNGNMITVQFKQSYTKKTMGLARFVDPIDNTIYLQSLSSNSYLQNIFPNLSQYNQKAAYKLGIEAPKDWRIISDMKEKIVSLPNRDKRFWVFPMSQIINTNSFSFIAGPFDLWQTTVKNTPIRIYARPSLAKKANASEWLVTTKLGMAFYQNYFNSKYPYQKLDQVFLPIKTMANNTSLSTAFLDETLLTTNNSDQEIRRKRIHTVLNNMANIWLNKSIKTASSQHQWILDGYASYTTELAQKQLTPLYLSTNEQTPVQKPDIEKVTGTMLEPESNASPQHIASSLDSLNTKFDLSIQKNGNAFFTHLTTFTEKTNPSLSQKIAQIPYTCTQEGLNQINQLLRLNPDLPQVIKSNLETAKNESEKCLQ